MPGRCGTSPSGGQLTYPRRTLGHAHHFLSRLDRVSLPQVEVALDLYNDVPLLKFILESARIPEGAARVAISLDHPEHGPFLVVTREGRFVTCLGEGMTVADLPVITRGQLDGIAAKAGVLRARMEAAQRLAGRMGGVGKLLRRVHEAADDLSREEIVAIAGLQPLYALEFIQCLFAASTDLIDSREILLKHLRKSDRLFPAFRDSLRSYWNTLWSIGHFSVLGALDGWASAERWPAELRHTLESAHLSWPAVREGLAPLALKGLWAVGRVGKPLLAKQKEVFRGARTPFTHISGGAGLAMIGLRHGKLYAEVVKVLASGPDIEASSPTADLMRALTNLLLAIVKPEGGAPAAFAVVQQTLGAQRWAALSRDLPPGAPLRFERPEDVPEDLARCAAANDPFDFMKDTTAVTPMFTMLPWVARAAPEQLYLPREAIRASWAPWEPEHSLRHLRLHRDYFLYRRKPPKAEGPARKGPCPCGSGKKYKRCCGVEGAEEESEAGERVAMGVVVLGWVSVGISAGQESKPPRG